MICALYQTEQISEAECRLTIIHYLHHHRYALATQATLNTGLPLLESDSSSRPEMLYFVLKHASIELIDFFLNVNFDFANLFHEYNSNGYHRFSTFLMIIVQMLHVDMTRRLLQIPTVVDSISSVDHKGRTALHQLANKLIPERKKETNQYAIREGHVIMELLLAAGIDRHVRDKAGQTAEEILRNRAKQESLADLLSLSGT